jgi:hypothetical protein
LVLLLFVGAGGTFSFLWREFLSNGESIYSLLDTLISFLLVSV